MAALSLGVLAWTAAYVPDVIEQMGSETVVPGGVAVAAAALGPDRLASTLTWARGRDEHDTFQGRGCEASAG